MPFLFTPEMNWLNPLTEDIEYETAIISSHSQRDQRISLLDTPNRRLTYSISALDELEALRLESLIRRVQAESCYVPYWRGARRPSAINLVPGFATQIFVDTVYAGFEIDNWVMLFENAHHAEVAKIVEVQPTYIVTDVVIPGTDPLLWPLTRTKVVPVFLGQLGAVTTLDYAAKFAKTTQVAFDIHPVKRELSGDCNWGTFNLYPDVFPPATTWVIDPTGGPTGGPAMKLTIPANSRIGGSIFAPETFFRIVGLPLGQEFSMTAKVKTSWDVSDPLLGVFDGVPGILLAVVEAPPVGTTFVPATPAAHNAWETLSTTEVTDVLGQLMPSLAVSEGTVSPVPLFAWFADIVIRDSEDNIVWSCLPSPAEVIPTETPIFTPLTALHRPGQSLQKVQRAVDTLSSPAGPFSVRPRSTEPYTEHSLDLVFFSAEEVYAFLLFLDTIRGSFGAFWLPSYQQDLTPIGIIGPADVAFNISHTDYTTLDFPGTQRRQIAFVQPDGSFTKRSITAAVDNGDGTETLTINEALGFSFAQNNANGICFLWYGRLFDDVVSLEWIDADRATLQLTMIEIADPPDGGSGDSADGFLSDIP